MSLYKIWTQQKQPTYKFSKVSPLKDGDLVIVSDQKNFILEHAQKYLDKWQVEDLKAQIQVAHWSYTVADKTVHLYLHSDLQDVNVGGFESCKYYAFKKLLGHKLSMEQSSFSLILDPKFRDSELFVRAFAESLCSISYAYKNKKAVNLNVSLDSKWQVIFKDSFLKALGVNLARFLVDLPPNELNPTTYAQLIKDIVGSSKHYKVESISKDLASKGYGLIHAVGKGSESPPQLVRAVSSSASKKVAIVGKGITFDTGGLDLKPSKFMRNMKKDMGGSAAALGILYYLILSQQKVDVDFYFALAENSVGASSFRPGDILTAGNGLTVEIDNTDAEGRLVLADALSWLGQEKKQPQIVIDIATLTGAIKVGLGTHTGGLFSNDKKLSDELYTSSLETGDFVWPMPMPFWSESEMQKSDVADLVNSSAAGYGGAITAAQFLKFFVPAKTRWAHLDIYSWVDGKRDVIRQTGGSGQAVMLLIDWLENHT
jgi:leucyl aminopeptidase